MPLKQAVPSRRLLANEERRNKKTVLSVVVEFDKFLAYRL